MGMPSGMELIVIALVILLLFGGKKIPELAKGLGGGIRNFKKALKEDEEEEKKELEAKEEKSEVKATTSNTQEKKA